MFLGVHGVLISTYTIHISYAPPYAPPQCKTFCTFVFLPQGTPMAPLWPLKSFHLPKALFLLLAGESFFPYSLRFRRATFSYYFPPKFHCFAGLFCLHHVYILYIHAYEDVVVEHLLYCSTASGTSKADANQPAQKQQRQHVTITVRPTSECD